MVYIFLRALGKQDLQFFTFLLKILYKKINIICIETLFNKIFIMYNVSQDCLKLFFFNNTKQYWV